MRQESDKRSATDKAPAGVRVVVHRGIKIAPIVGTRSSTAKAVLEALQHKSERPLANAARG